MQTSRYISYGSPIKGWTILRCLEDDTDVGVKAGQWVIVYTTFLENKRPRTYPSFILNDIPLHDDEDLYNDLDFFMDRIDSFEESMRVDPQTGYGFYSSCMQDGFNPFLEDFYVWVADRISQQVIKAQSKLTATDIKRIMEMLVMQEAYEKAAIARDFIEGKTSKKIF